MAVDRARDPELSGPGIDIDLDETGADALGQRAALNGLDLPLHMQGLAIKKLGRAD